MTTKMESNSTQICRLCLEISDNFVNIFENYQQSTVASILAKHFWFQVNKDDGFSEWLCEICWINTTTFHDFYKRIEVLQTNQWNTVGANPLKEERSDSPTVASLEPELDILEYEDTKPAAPMLGLSLSTEEGCDSKDVKIFDQINSDDDSDNEDRPVNDSPKSDDFGDGNLTQQSDDVERRRYNTHSKAEKDRQDAKIREYFNMKCDLCSDFAFDTLLQAKKHYRTVHKKLGYLVCCGKKLHRRFKLMEHIRNHTNPDAYRCDTCGKRCPNKRSLTKHYIIHAPLESRPHKCTLCASSFTAISALNYHVDSKHASGETFPCDKCNKNFRSKLMLASHIRCVHVSAEYVCEICARRFKTKQLLRNHTECEHSTTLRPKVQCDICGVWLYHLKRHLKLHDKANFVAQTCPICKKVVQNKRYLASHIRTAHAERSHQCTLCDKAFKTAMNLKEHTAIHTGEDLYDCSYCEKKFKSNANKYSHVKKAHFAEWSRDCDKRNAMEKKSPDEMLQPAKNFVGET